MKEHILLLLAYVCLESQPQSALVYAQQLLHMDITEVHKFQATMYVAEALLQLNKPKQAIEYLTSSQKDVKLRCHSTLSPTSAVFTEDLLSKSVQLINLTSAYLQSNNLPQAQQTFNTLLNQLNITFQPSHSLGPAIPAPVVNLALYIALKLGNHSQAADIIHSRQVYSGMVFSKAKPRN